MSQADGRGPGTPARVSDERSWERPAAADDIVDPIGVSAKDGAATTGVDPYAATVPDFDREQTDEDAEDVPLDVQFTDALSMLAEGGHSYGRTPLAAGEVPVDAEAADIIEIDESSKDA